MQRLGRNKSASRLVTRNEQAAIKQWGDEHGLLIPDRQSVLLVLDRSRHPLRHSAKMCVYKKRQEEGKREKEAHLPR